MLTTDSGNFCNGGSDHMFPWCLMSSVSAAKVGI